MVYLLHIKQSTCSEVSMGFHCQGLWSSPRNQKTWPLPGDLLSGLWPTPLCLLKFTMGPCRGQKCWKFMEVLEVAMVHIKYCSKTAMKWFDWRVFMVFFGYEWLNELEEPHQIHRGCSGWSLNRMISIILFHLNHPMLEPCEFDDFHRLYLKMQWYIPRCSPFRILYTHMYIYIYYNDSNSNNNSNSNSNKNSYHCYSYRVFIWRRNFSDLFLGAYPAVQTVHCSRDTHGEKTRDTRFRRLMKRWLCWTRAKFWDWLQQSAFGARFLVMVPVSDNFEDLILTRMGSTRP